MPARATDAAIDPSPPPPRKRQPAATAAAPAPVTAPVTAPAVPAHEAFGNVITAQRDTAIVQEQALQSQLVGVEGQYERDLARLNAERDANVKALIQQIGQQASVIAAADAALESLTGANVVPIRSAVELAA